MDKEFIDFNGTQISSPEFKKLIDDRTKYEEWAGQKSLRKMKSELDSAYEDLRTRDIIGMKYISDPDPNKAGLYLLWNGAENIPEKQRRAYEYVAGYFRNLMSKTPTIEALKKEADEKEKARVAALPKLDDIEGKLSKYIIKNYLKGNGNTWSGYDNAKKLEVIKQMLPGFLTEIAGKEYNFADSPFKSIDEFNTAVTNFIANPNEDAFRELGLNYSSWQPQVAPVNTDVKPADVKLESENKDEEKVEGKSNIPKIRQKYKQYLTNFTLSGTNTLNIHSWNKSFEEALRLGLINLSSQQINEIGNFIKINGVDGENGRYMTEYPNIVLKNGNVYLLSDKKEASEFMLQHKILQNVISGNKYSRNFPKLDSSFTIDGKLFRVLPIKLSLDRIWQQPVSTSNIYVTPLAKLNRTPSNFIMIGGGDKKSKNISINDNNFSYNFKKLVASLLKDSRVKLTAEDIKKLLDAGWLKKGGKL